MSAPEVLRDVVASLESAEIPYMVTGSFASSYHGAPRGTQDIDIVISPSEEQLRTWAAKIPADRYYFDLDAAIDALRRRSMFNVIDLRAGWKVDLIVRKQRPFSVGEIERRKAIVLEGLSLFVASAEDVVLSKLEWAKRGESSRQIEDAAEVVRARWDHLDRSYLERWVRELSLDLQWDEALRRAGVSG